MKIRYRLMLGVIALSIGLCLMTYQSYALWIVTKESGESIVSVGCFEFSYEEVAGSNINLTNAYPMSDAKGLALTPYQFTIKNTCTVNAAYDVTLNTLTSNTMQDDWIKFAIGKTLPTTGVRLDTLSTKNQNVEEIKAEVPDLATSYVLESGELAPEEVVSYQLYLWMDEGAPNAAMGTTFEASINVIASAIPTDTTGA